MLNTRKVCWKRTILMMFCNYSNCRLTFNLCWRIILIVVCLSACLYLSVGLPIHVSVYLSIYYVCISVCVCLSTYLFMYLYFSLALSTEVCVFFLTYFLLLVTSWIRTQADLVIAQVASPVPSVNPEFHCRVQKMERLSEYLDAIDESGLLKCFGSIISRCENVRSYWHHVCHLLQRQSAPTGFLLILLTCIALFLVALAIRLFPTGERVAWFPADR